MEDKYSGEDKYGDVFITIELKEEIKLFEKKFGDRNCCKEARLGVSKRASKMAILTFI